MSRSFITVTLSAVAAAGLVSLGSITHAAQLATDIQAPASVTAPEISWGPCPDAPGFAKELTDCGTMAAPLDYSAPDGEQITVHMGRIKASDQSRKLGTLFYNPGGPGSPAMGRLGNALSLVSPEVRERFDIVGIDPRGIGNTEPLECALPEGVSAPALPWRAGDTAHLLQVDRILRGACSKANPRIGNFMTTADVARDMDRAREAVGDAKLTFLGVSYGTYVAATYANLFPNNVRAIVADSALDPIAYTQGRDGQGVRVPSFGRIGSVYGARDARRAMIADCEAAGPQRCPQAETIRADWDFVDQHIKHRDAVIPGGPPLDYAQWTMAVLSAHYRSGNVPAIVATVSLVADTWRAEDAGQPPRASLAPATENPDVAAVLRAASEKPWLAEAADHNGLAQADATVPIAFQSLHMLGVVCSETRNPADPTQVVGAATEADSVAQGEGAFRMWQSSACTHWPFIGKNAYRGDFAATPSQGVLVIGNEFDTATPFHLGTKRMHDTLRNSRLVTVEHGYGHIAARTSTCARNALSSYVLSGMLPATNLTCTQDERPWGS